MRRAGLAVFAGIALTASSLATPGVASAHPSTAAKPTPQTSAPAHRAQARRLPTFPAVRACPPPTRRFEKTCFSEYRSDITPQLGHLVDPPGLHPADLKGAYGLPATGGSGQTIAVIDAYDDPNLESDLALYRSQFGLPACTTANGCFRKVNQTGGTSLPVFNQGWGLEEGLDLDMASAICPNCKLLLVEATTPFMSNLGTAVNTAVSLGAKFVSNSYGGGEDSTDPSSDSAYFNHPGVAITVSSGDSGYGVQYPAASHYVTAVGGTSLYRSTSTARGWNEYAWNGAGSGCSVYDAKATWQTDSGCARRTVADVSADADPNTGVSVYDSHNGGWLVVGGTSASAPIIAATYALGGTPTAGTYPASYPYAHPSSLWDVLSGSNGSCSPAYLCTASTGYDGPTGLGTPHGSTAFSGAPHGNVVTVTAPGNQTTTVGAAVSLQIHATDSAAGQTLTYSAAGLPAGLSINASTGLISGRPTTTGTTNVTVTVRDTTGANGVARFTWTVNPAGTRCSSPGNKVVNGGFESGITPWTTTANVISANGGGQTAHSGTHFAWLDGYGQAHTDSATQTVTIPAGCHATLSYWLHIDTAERGTTAFDRLVVSLGGTTLATYSNVNAAAGYVQRTIDVSAFAGRTVTLSFVGTEDASLQTSFVLDDVTLTGS